MLRLDWFWITVLWALVLAALSKVGFGVIADKLLSLYSLLFNRAEYRAFIQSWRKLREARTTLATISAQDEFAKWARQQRTVDQLQATFDRQNGQRQRSTLAKQMGVAVLLRVLVYGVTAWCIGWRTRSMPVLSMPEGFLGPLGRILSLPGSTADTVSTATLFVLSHVALKHSLG